MTHVYDTRDQKAQTGWLLTQAAYTRLALVVPHAVKADAGAGGVAVHDSKAMAPRLPGK